MISIKIKRHEYKITNDDIFMDNGACVQLLSQSKEPSNWGHQPNPVLSKRAVKEINAYKRIEQKHSYTTDVQVFSLDV